MLFQYFCKLGRIYELNFNTNNCCYTFDYILDDMSNNVIHINFKKKQEKPREFAVIAFPITEEEIDVYEIFQQLLEALEDEE